MTTPASDPFAALDATAQSELVQRGEVSPRELVEAAITRIERLNPALNAVITPLFEQALAQATASELPRGSFRGVPLLLKDYLCTTAGDPYTEGMGLLRDLDWRAEQDSVLATRFKQAGFVILGKTNLPELALSALTEGHAFGPAHNPWDFARSPGGSSGGSAVAVASGMVPVAHANDGTGSIRIPASCCGLVGLKPSRGRTSLGPGHSPGLLGNVVEHVLTRTVRDAAAILDAVAGPMPGDLFIAPAAQRPYAAEVGVEPGRLRVGILNRDIFLHNPVDPTVAAVTATVGRLLEQLGHDVEEAHPAALEGPTGLGLALRIIAASGVAARLSMWEERLGRTLTPEDVEPATWERAEEGRRFSAVEVHAAVQRLVAGVCRCPEWWAEGYDLLVTPTMQQLPPAIGEKHDLAAVFGLFTMPWSITGQPAISLPLGWSAQAGRPDLPIGVQLIANCGREDVLIRVASQLESSQPWNDRMPLCAIR